MISMWQSYISQELSRETFIIFVLTAAYFSKTVPLDWKSFLISENIITSKEYKSFITSVSFYHLSFVDTGENCGCKLVLCKPGVCNTTCNIRKFETKLEFNITEFNATTVSFKR